MIETDIDPFTPRLRWYSRWIGDRLRAWAKVRSTGALAVAGVATKGTGT